MKEVQLIKKLYLAIPQIHIKPRLSNVAGAFVGFILFNQQLVQILNLLIKKIRCNEKNKIYINNNFKKTILPFPCPDRKSSMSFLVLSRASPFKRGSWAFMYR